jgi:hypothetical protein
MRSSQTIGDACPVPGTWTFQAIFFPLGPFQVVGIAVSRLVPSFRGPRQQGQFSERAGRVEQIAASNRPATENCFRTISDSARFGGL